jgi:hypothetical protein
MPETYTHATVEEWCFILACAEGLYVEQSLELSSVVRRQPAGNGISAEAEESPLLKPLSGNDRL